eukprot:SAG22_NODE_7144_length_771_cov_1.916667_2_plen_47_part_00
MAQGLGRKHNAVSWQGGRGQVHEWEMKYFPTEVTLTVAHHDEQVSE